MCHPPCLTKSLLVLENVKKTLSDPFTKGSVKKKVRKMCNLQKEYKKDFLKCKVELYVE